MQQLAGAAIELCMCKNLRYMATRECGEWPCSNCNLL